MSIEEVRTYINSLRKGSADQPLDENGVHSNPIEQFSIWLEEAVNMQSLEPNAMVLATVSEIGYPSTRVVYMRDISEDGVIFYTNYKSQKGKELNNNSAASLLFFWPELERQIRIFGKVEKVNAKVSDEYFKSRPRESQLGAWASDQSEVIESRNALNEKYAYYEEKFRGLDVPRPENWGGFLVRSERFEFWQGRPNRLHDRIVYVKSGDGQWDTSRISP